MTKEEVFELAQLFGGLPQDQADQLLAELRREQPGLYSFLKGFESVFPDLDECNKVRSIAVTTWLIPKRSAEPPGLVTQEMILDGLDAYEAELVRLAAVQGKARQKVTAEVVLAHPEPALLAYVTMMVKHGATPPFQDESFLRAHKLLRVILHALIASRGHKAGRRLRRGPGGRA